MSYLISLEGIDGSGTTSLASDINNEYKYCVTTAEPTDSSYGKQLRESLSDDSSDPLIDFYLFMADRRDHLQRKIIPALKSGNMVVTDRYVDSTRAYQPIALTDYEDSPFDSSWQAKMFIEQNIVGWVREPDYTFYLDVDIDTALDRASCDEKYENRAMLEQVLDNYRALAETQDRIIKVDATQSREAVADCVFEHIDDIYAGEK